MLSKSTLAEDATTAMPSEYEKLIAASMLDHNHFPQHGAFYLIPPHVS